MVETREETAWAAVEEDNDTLFLPFLHLVLAFKVYLLSAFTFLVYVVLLPFIHLFLTTCMASVHMTTFYNLIPSWHSSWTSWIPL